MMAKLPTIACVLCFLRMVVSAKDSTGSSFEDIGAAKGSHKKFTVSEEVWFDVLIRNGSETDGGEDFMGRFVIAVFGDTCPMTAVNFISLVKGYKMRSGKNLHYKNTPIHRIVPDFVIQMGDVSMKDGTGGESIFGNTFVDENFDLSHQAAGYVAMANHGTDTNSSQFYILLSKARWLDGKHVVFGKVIKGMDVIRRIADEKTDTNSAVPYNEIMIVDCGVVGINQKYVLTQEQSLSDEDL